MYFVGIYPVRSIMVNGAEVVIADVKAKNGVVHVINRVILPPSMAKSK